MEMKKRGWKKGVKRGSKKLASIGYYEVMEKLKKENRPTEGLLSDGHLCLLYQKGDRFALGILYERHRAFLAALAQNAMDYREGSLTEYEIESEIYMILSDAAATYFKAKGKVFTEVCAMKLIEALTPEMSECVLTARIDYEEDVRWFSDSYDESLKELICDTPTVEHLVETQCLKEYIAGFLKRL